MGADGAAGMLKMRQAGARTIAQDEQGSVVFGMPTAIRIGPAEKTVGLKNIARAALYMFQKKHGRWYDLPL